MKYPEINLDKIATCFLICFCEEKIQETVGTPKVLYWKTMKKLAEQDLDKPKEDK